MVSYLTFLQFCNLRKPHTVLKRAEPFEDLDEEEFRRRFRITKTSAVMLLAEVNCTVYSPTHFVVRI